MSCGITDMGACVKDGAQSAIEALAHAIEDSCAWMIKESFTWWIDTNTDGVNTSVVDSIRQVMLPVTIAVAVAGVILVGIKMVVSGKPDPLISLGEGLFKLAFWTTCGTATVNLFMQASAGFSKWVLDQATGRAFGARLAEIFGFAGLDNMFAAIILLGILGFLAGVVQWILGLLREGSVIVLTGCLPLAAAGQLAGFGRAWLPKVFGWTLALIFWEPGASLIDFTAFKLIGNGRGPTEVLVGLSMMLLSLLALPVLIKLFSWASGSVMDSSGGTMAALAGFGAAALRLQASRDGSGAQPISAAQHAQMISQNLPDPGQNPQGATPPPPPTPEDSPGAPPPPSTPQGDPGGNIPSQSTGAQVAAGTGAETAAATTAGASTVAGPAGVAVEAAQIVHGAANSAANNMTNPPSSE
ncbi:MAG: hypothetical protein JO362_07930 [Streptomycetaceae bacterium]|nr:hypothetical protein [Streptomycetaceae bacterium]